MTRRYAEGTTVSVAASRAEITGILAKHGVVRMAWGAAPEGDTLQFEIDGGSYRFFIAKPTVADIRRLYPTAYQAAPKLDGEWLRRWRAHLLLLKAKLEFAAAGDSTVLRELMPFRVLTSGQTLEEAIADGGVPLLSAGTKR